MPHLPLAWQVRKMAHSSFGLFSAINLVLTQGGSHKAPTHKAPIGVFDSGVGGLSILNHLQKRLPHERYIYFADTAHVPYGERSDSEIETLTHEAVHWLYQQKCKLVVVACNSASAHSLHTLRSYYGDRLPVVGLVPAIKPAAQKSQTKHIAVLATKATLKGKLLADVIDEYARPLGVTVHPFSCLPWCLGLRRVCQASMQP